MSAPQLRDLEKALPSEKPSLLEIGAMPYPLSMVAMRRFYNKDWHKPEPDGKSLGKWKVTIEYTTRSTEYFDCEVEALCEADAEKLAEEKFDKNADYDDEIQETKVEFVEKAA